MSNFENLTNQYGNATDQVEEYLKLSPEEKAEFAKLHPKLGAAYARYTKFDSEIFCQGVYGMLDNISDYWQEDTLRAYEQLIDHWEVLYRCKDQYDCSFDPDQTIEIVFEALESLGREIELSCILEAPEDCSISKIALMRINGTLPENYIEGLSTKPADIQETMLYLSMYHDPHYIVSEQEMAEQAELDVPEKITVPANRAESGPMQFSDEDWPGVFIRGDMAVPMGSFLEILLTHVDRINKAHQVVEGKDAMTQELMDAVASLASQKMNVAVLRGFSDFLKSCEVQNGKDPEGLQRAALVSD